MTNARDEAKYWEDQATTIRRGALQAIRATASKWEATIATLLGVFGASAFIAGPDKLDDLEAPWWIEGLLVVALLVAVVLALGAIWKAAYAAQGSPTSITNLVGEDVEAWTRDETDLASARLREARNLGLGAGIVIVAGSMLAIGAGTFKAPSKPTKLHAVLTQSSGNVVCGELTNIEPANPGTLQLVVGDQLIQFATGDSISVVEGCPTPPATTAAPAK